MKIDWILEFHNDHSFIVGAEKELSSEDSSCNTPYYYTIFFILSHDVFVQSMGFTAGHPSGQLDSQDSRRAAFTGRPLLR